jgi:hypothetical protein
MEIPRLLLRRIRDPSCPEERARDAIRRLSGDASYPPEEVFALLVLAYRVETRHSVLDACVQGIVETLARAVHTDFLHVQLNNFLADKSDRSARVLVGIVAEPRIPAELRLAALDRLEGYDDSDLSADRLEQLESVLAGRLDDAGEDGEVAIRLATSRWREQR